MSCSPVVTGATAWPSTQLRQDPPAQSFLTAGFPVLEPGGLGKAASIPAASVPVLGNHFSPHSYSLIVTLRQGYLETCE